MTASKRGVTLCPRCGSKSQIEHTQVDTTGHVRRLRGCVKCGNTWSTAEISMLSLKRTAKIEKFIKAVSA